MSSSSENYNNAVRSAGERPAIIALDRRHRLSILAGAAGHHLQADKAANPKRDECASAVDPEMICRSFGFGSFSTMTNCENKDLARRTPADIFVDKGRILDYCSGWDQPFARVQPGYEILSIGWLRIFAGVFFAWFANPIGAVAFALSLMRHYKTALVLSFSAVMLGTESFLFSAEPQNESGSDKFFVDHLGVGFYVWEASFLLMRCSASSRSARPAIP